jgi:hypothetical protein
MKTGFRSYEQIAMKVTACRNRDGYLGRWLAADEQAEFKAHLATCADCRRFIQEQQRLDRLLARANTALLPVPAGLIDQLEHRLRLARRRRFVTWAAEFAAAGLLICALWGWLLPHRVSEEEPLQPPVVVRPARRQSEPTRDPRSLVRVTFQAPSDVIAVPHETDNPSVTIIWVYPTIKTAQEPAPAAADSF